MLPKDGSRFGHHAFADLSQEWEMFTLQLDCWRIEKGLTRRRAVKQNARQSNPDQETGPIVNPLETQANAPKKGAKKTTSGPVSARAVKKPAPEAPALPPPPMQHLSSWGEMMRAYEHVKEAA